MPSKDQREGVTANQDVCHVGSFQSALCSVCLAEADTQCAGLANIGPRVKKKYKLNPSDCIHAAFLCYIVL